MLNYHEMQSYYKSIKDPQAWPFWAQVLGRAVAKQGGEDIMGYATRPGLRGRAEQPVRARRARRADSGEKYSPRVRAAIWVGAPVLLWTGLVFARILLF